MNYTVSFNLDIPNEYDDDGTEDVIERIKDEVDMLASVWGAVVEDLIIN